MQTDRLQPSASNQIASDGNSSPSPARILVVDDEARLRQSLTLLLENEGYIVDSAADGRQAIEKLTLSEFDLAVLDLAMPEVNGLAVLNYAKEKELSTAILICSGTDDIDVATKSVANGALGYVLKPYLPGELMKQVRQVLKKRRDFLDRQEAVSHIRKSEELHRFIVNASPDLIFILDAQGRLAFYNQRLLHSLNLDSRDLTGKPFLELVDDRDRSRAKVLISSVREQAHVTSCIELRLMRRPSPMDLHIESSRELPVELHLLGIFVDETPTSRGEFNGSYGVARDLTEHKRAERTLERQLRENQELARERELALTKERSLQKLINLGSEVNQLIIRAQSLDEVLRGTCQRITCDPNFKVAWIALLGDVDGKLEIGYKSDLCKPPYLDDSFQVSIRPGTPLAQGPAGRSINENRLVVINDIASDATFLPWRARAQASGVKSVIGLPLRPGEKRTPYGTFLIYSENPFTNEAIHLLNEVADSVGRAIHLHKEIAHRETAQRAVQASEQRLKYVIEGADLGYWDWHYRSGRHEVNDRWLQILGLERANIRNEVSDWSERVHPEDRPLVKATVNKAIGNNSPYRVEFRIRHQDSTWVWVESAGAVVEWSLDHKDPIRLCGTYRDISQRKTMEAYLQENEKRFKELIDALPNIAVRGYDTEGKVIYWNKSSESLYGFSRQQAVGTRLEELIVPLNMREELNNRFFRWVADKKPIPPAEMVLINKDCEPVPVYSSHVQLNQNSDAPEMYCIDVDLREQKRAQAELEHMASYDLVTRLPNRYCLERELNLHLGEAVGLGTQLALLFIDLDNFKLINDSFGHGFGDLLLKQVAKRMQTGLRQHDFLARFGGDEFVLLMPLIHNTSDVSVLAAKIIGMFTESFEVQGQEIYVTTSIGIGMYPDDGHKSGELLKHADAAMYRAKESGRNRYSFFTPAMNGEIRRQHHIDDRLRKALKNENLELHYQPQIELSSGRITSLEALLRWEDAKLGPLSPTEFIPVAEKSDLINQLGLWIIDRACRQKAEWKRQGLPDLRVDVNLSGRQFAFGEVLSPLIRALQRFDLNPSEIGIELTEQVLIEADNNILKVLTSLREGGCKVSIDDFGTGYSSLSYLKRFPIDTIKIDRSFIRDVPGDPDDSTIVEAIVALGHSLGLSVLAEGVENSHQRDFVLERGCDLAQGYWFHRPLSAGEVTRLLT